MSIIAVSELVKTYGRFRALDSVSFEVDPGETFALLGPNGSGKTTALKCLAGLTVPTSGTLKIGGLDLKRQPTEARNLISYLPQRVSFHESLTAREVMEFYCRLRRLNPSRIDQLFSMSSFHFNGSASRPVGQFSGGMIQRLGLAVACLPDAPIILLDEPTVSLDPHGAIEFRAFLTGMKRAGKTIVISSHMLADVEELADRVAILVDGKLVGLEPIQSLRQNLENTGRMEVVMATPGKEWIDVAVKAGASTATIDGESLFISCAPEKRLDVLRAIESAGGQVVSFSTKETSLEDVYLRYIGESEKHGK
ncbi:MAG TPA: ABC transporter ATP-binding protein [Blastocatellia bacterium]|nr:ABC transporter ATP-binding protein [Blastocatellia bacterium]